jgi:hypothetical protein
MGLTDLWNGIASATKKGYNKVMDWLGFGGGSPKFDARAGRYRDPKTGRFVSTSTAKATGKGASKGAAKAGVKAATKNAVKRTAGKTIAKTIGKGVLGGVAGLGLSIAGDVVHDYGAGALQSMGVGEKAATNTANYGGSALKGAALGATIGSVIPGFGTLLGGALGGLAGLVAQAGKDIYDNYKTNKAEKEAQQAAAHTTGNYNTASNEGSVSQISREETNAHLKNIIAALNKMNSNLSPDVQHELDRQYLREMSGYMPAPESAWDSSPMGISKNIFAQSPMIK